MYSVRKNDKQKIRLVLREREKCRQQTIWLEKTEKLNKCNIRILIRSKKQLQSSWTSRKPRTKSAERKILIREHRNTWMNDAVNLRIDWETSTSKLHYIKPHINPIWDDI